MGTRRPTAPPNPPPRPRPAGFRSGFCASAVNRGTAATTAHYRSSYSTGNRSNRRKQQLQLSDTTEAEHTTATHDHENRTPNTKTRPDTTRHNRTPKHNQLHTTITHTSRRKQNTIMSTEAPETSYTPHTETHTHTSTRKPTQTHRQTCTQTPDTLFERLWSFGFGVSRVFRVLRLR